MKNPEVVKQLKAQAPDVRASLEKLQKESDPAKKKEIQQELREKNKEMQEKLLVARYAILANEVQADEPLPPRYEMVDESMA